MTRKFIFCSSYVWHYAKCYAKPDITECFMVIFVEQPDKLYWVGVKINGLIT